MSTELRERIIVACVFVPLILLLLWLGELFWLGFLVVVVILSQWELYHIFKPHFSIAEFVLLVISALVLPLLFWLRQPVYLELFLPSFIIIESLIIVIRDDVSKGIENISFMLLSLFLFVVFPYYSWLIRIDFGFLLTFFIIATVWINDTAAYFVGIKWGKQKLSPSLSPHKTVEGLLGGVIASLIVAAVFYIAGLKSIEIYILPVGIFIALIGELGDLVESAIKRKFQVKDSSGIIPGHGGLLDRFDSYFFIQPALYYLLKLLLGIL